MATIRDVAHEANVSVATVSRILNNDSTLQTSADTKKRVINAAKKLGYEKKQKNINIKTKKTIGILQWFSARQESEDYYYLHIRQGIEDCCIKNKFGVVRKFKSDMDYMDAFSKTDGVICIGKFSSEEIASLKKQNKNIIFIDMPINDIEISTITLDFDQSVTYALSYLLEKGHKKIGFLGGQEYLADGSLFDDKRVKIYKQFIKKNKLEYKKIICDGEFTKESGYNMAKELIEAGNMPTAIFAASDSIAMGAMTALIEQGYKIPNDISIIGFDNTNISAYTNPPLTTMNAPTYEMGQYSVKLIMQMIANELPCPVKVLLPCTLVERQSCK